MEMRNSWEVKFMKDEAMEAVKMFQILYRKVIQKSAYGSI